MADTIFALSSGAPPAALAVIRISGPDAGASLISLAGALPKPRAASLRTLRDTDGAELDRALILWFPGPATATGEDLAELHLHGGRAVIAAVENALARLPGLRRATPGEFTRRAFANGKIDLAEAEGLGDLLGAETELQRRQAMAWAGGALSARVGDWREAVLIASARVEAVLDFGDEDDVDEVPAEFMEDLAALRDQIAMALDAPRAEVLREGFRVVLAGPPNSGKSSLFNVLVEDEAAITAPSAGTTRDILTRSVALAGVPFQFVDTAGLRGSTSDTIEAIGIARARGELERADLVLWLGPEGEGSADRLWEIESFVDDPTAPRKQAPKHRVSAMTGEGLAELRVSLMELARDAFAKPGMVALNERQANHMREALLALEESCTTRDVLVLAELLRTARLAFDKLLGRAATEDMLDALFGRFCIGK